jgi:hypothetical protein
LPEYDITPETSRSWQLTPSWNAGLPDEADELLIDRAPLRPARGAAVVADEGAGVQLGPGQQGAQPALVHLSRALDGHVHVQVLREQQVLLVGREGLVNGPQRELGL